MPGISLPLWLDGTIVGILLLVVVLPFIATAIQVYKKKALAEGTLLGDLLQQLRERDEALAKEREANSKEQGELRTAHAEQIRQERENGTRLQERVLDLSGQLVRQAQEYAIQVVGAVERVGDKVAEVERKLEHAQLLNHECEKRHIERNKAEEQRRREEDERNALRDSKIAQLVALVAGMTPKP